MYAGGDVASMARFVTEAIGMGKRAAREIDRVLRGNARGVDGGGDDAGAEVDAEPVVELAAINTFYYPRQARAVEQRLPAAKRLASDARFRSASISSKRSPKPDAASPAAPASSATTAFTTAPISR